MSVSRSMVCRVSVDLPMPGSPPKRMMEPGTNPPPRTRFSSPSSMSMRGSSLAEMSRRRSTLAALLPLADMVPADLPGRVGAVLTLISLNVFHRPQAGHLPIHLADSCPQFSQTYAVLSFIAGDYMGDLDMMGNVGYLGDCSQSSSSMRAMDSFSGMVGRLSRLNQPPLAISLRCRWISPET